MWSTDEDITTLRFPVEHPVVKAIPIVPIPLPTRTFGPVTNPSSDIEISE
jgi:hypothetical protein